MSNELATLLQQNPELAIPTGLDEDTLAVAGSLNQSKRISIEGGVFRKIAGGKEVAALEDRHMNIIFVKMAHTANRMFYTKAYKKGVKVSPVCWSSDSHVPDADVKTPQAKSCDSCPHSVKGSGQNGTGSACRLSWRTAVVLPNDPSGDVLQLTIPAASCFGKEENGKQPFRPYIQTLANNNISAGRIVTKMQFDMKSSAPRLLFSPAGVVPPEDYDVILSQAKSKTAEQYVKLTVYQSVDSEGEDGENESFEGTNTTMSANTVSNDVDVEGEAIPEPSVRSSAPASAEPVKAASDVLKKWAKKE